MLSVFFVTYHFYGYKSKERLGMAALHFLQGGSQQLENNGSATRCCVVMTRNGHPLDSMNMRGCFQSYTKQAYTKAPLRCSFLVCLFLLFETGFCYSYRAGPGPSSWPQTQRDPPASASRVPRLSARTTTTWLLHYSFSL